MEHRIEDFRAGDRIELHPATSMWMMGARYGTVMRVGRNKVTVNLDRIRRDVKLPPSAIGEILVRE
jgi:hypothetical protein